MKELRIKRLEVNYEKLNVLNVSLPCYMLTEENETVKLIISEGVSIRNFKRENAPRPSEVKPRWLSESKKE